MQPFFNLKKTKWTDSFGAGDGAKSLFSISDSRMTTKSFGEKMINVAFDGTWLKFGRACQ